MKKNVARKAVYRKKKRRYHSEGDRRRKGIRQYMTKNNEGYKGVSIWRNIE